MRAVYRAGPVRGGDETREALKRVVGNADFSLVCSLDAEHRWAHKYVKFRFDGHWLRHRIQGSLFDGYINELPMPAAKDLNDYDRVQLGVTKKSGYTPNCPLCRIEGRYKQSILVLEYPRGGL